MASWDRVIRYVNWCIEEQERKVPIYVKRQAEAWIKIYNGENKEAYFSEPDADKICKLLGIMKHPDLPCSILEGIEDYAFWFVIATLCTKDKSNGSRYYETALLEIARKNFKTFSSAVIFIILLLTEPQFSRFFSVAPDLSLSSELEKAVKKIITVSPALHDDLNSVFKLLRKQVVCKINDSEYNPLAYSKDRLDGKLATAWLADECGAMDSYPIEAMRSSQITLKNKLGIVISTQYPNDNNAMTDEIDISKKVLDGLLDNERRFSLLYEPDDDLRKGDNWQTDDRVIYQANPVTISHEYIFEDLIKKRATAVLYENKRENFLCKHCNILYRGLGVEGFIDILKVKECAIVEDLDFWVGKRVFVGLDLSMTNDNTAVAMVTMFEGIVYAKVIGFLPKNNIDVKTQKEKVDYKKLIANGDCQACGDEVIDYLEIKEKIKSLEDVYGVSVQQVGYDKWNALATVQALEADGFECVEIRQHSSTLHMPTKWLEELILDRRFKYDKNRLLEINFENARCTEDTNKNKYVNKKKSTGKVDMVVALINALFLLQQEVLYGMDFIVQTF